ncbi:MAG TPA: acyltransferase [Allosphingosinicella sp.]
MEARLAASPALWQHFLSATASEAVRSDREKNPLFHSQPGASQSLMSRDIHMVESLRGFAALSVCLFHLTGDGLPNVAVPEFHRLWSWGWAGVDVFFVISGFVIPYAMLRDGYVLRRWPGFLGRRIMRVGPPSWIMLALTIATFLALDTARGRGPLWSKDLSVVQFLCNATYIIPFTHLHWISLNLWTLAVEVQFYVVIAAIFPVLFRNIPSFIGCTLALCLVRYLPLPHGLVFFWYAPLFLTGAATFLYVGRRVGAFWYLGSLLALALVTYVQLGLTPTIAGVLTGLAIAFVKLKRLTGFFGKISYSLYLLHPLVGATAALLVERVTGSGGSAAKLLIVGSAVGASILAAWLFHQHVERPFIALSKALFGRRHDAQPAL